MNENMNNLISESVYENLPEILNPITQELTGRERDVVLLSSLGVLSACMPNVVGEYAKKSYAPNLFVFLIAPPASAKGKMELALPLVNRIHDELISNSKNEISECRELNKGKEFNCPKLDLKLVPGNISSTRLYSHLQTSQHGLIIFETEADSLSKSLKQEWGDFSDLLRKTWHHERISLSRESEDKYMEVICPKLSVVLSGTLDQVGPLVKSNKNGLFSRFSFYYFEEGSEWKDVSPFSYSVDHNEISKSIGNEVYEIYNVLKGFKKVKFDLTKNQWNILNQNFAEVNNDFFLATENLEFISTVKRHGLMLFRICMIMTILRNFKSLKDQDILYCDEMDFKISFSIIRCLLNHALKIFELAEREPLDLSTKDYSFLSFLPGMFRRMDAIEIGNNLGIPERTVDYKLNKWSNDKRILKKDDIGHYTKVINVKLKE